MIKFKTYGFLALLMALIIGCNGKSNDQNRASSETEKANNESQEMQADAPKVDRTAMIQQLQGEWKEVEYPFRRAEFENATVKFTEEGTVEAPEFKQFEISGQCPFNTEQSKSRETISTYIVMTEDKTCQEIEISSDTLIFSGFNTNTNSRYEILYKKLK